MSDVFDKLKAEFPRESVSWRAQSMKQDGTAALALAYIDARDVMRRLDDVCGPAGWQDRYEVHGAKTICYLSIRIGDEWVTKADGAGDTDVEAEKGSISDAFKRAAVKWGIGRYLYDLDAPWVDCDSYERGGKRYWKAWKQDPWSKLRRPLAEPARKLDGALSAEAAGLVVTAAKEAAKLCKSTDDLRSWWVSHLDDMKAKLPQAMFEDLKAWVTDRAQSFADDRKAA